MSLREIILKPKLDYRQYIKFKHKCLDLHTQPSKRVAELIKADIEADAEALPEPEIFEPSDKLSDGFEVKGVEIEA